MSKKPNNLPNPDDPPEVQAMVANRDKPLATMGSLYVWRDHYSLNGKLFPIAGAYAEVVSTGDTSKRVTGTRLALMGPLALAAKKKTDNREVSLVIGGPLFDGSPHLGNTVKFLPAGEVLARKIAALINQLSASLQPAAAPTPPPMPQPIVVAAAAPQSALGVADELAKLGELRSAGILSEDEFAAAKARLLG